MSQIAEWRDRLNTARNLIKNNHLALAKKTLDSISEELGEQIKKDAEYKFSAPKVNINNREVFKPKPQPRCLSRRDNDEWICSTCSLRWEVGEERPACPV